MRPECNVRRISVQCERGPARVYQNVGIPGTGLWTRERIDSPSPKTGSSPLPEFLPSATEPVTPPAVPPLTPPFGEIRSASTEALTSDSMEQLRRVLADTYEERESLGMDIGTATSEPESAKQRYDSWGQGFVFEKGLQKSF